MLVTHVNPTDKVSEVKSTFDGARGRSLPLDGKVLDDNMTVKDCIPPDCNLEWAPAQADDAAPNDAPHSPDSGFIASNLSGGITVSLDGLVTSTRRASCPTVADPPSQPKPAAASNACTHWLECGTCPFADRCHFAFTHTEPNAGREHAVCLAGKPVCKHWVSDGKCPLKSCFWKATHTPQNSPRYAKYLKATPMSAPVFEVDSVNGGAHSNQPNDTSVPFKSTAHNGHTTPNISQKSHGSVESSPGHITVMKRRTQPSNSQGTGQPPSPTITVMKRQHQHQPQPQQMQQQRVVAGRGGPVNYSLQPKPVGGSNQQHPHPQIHNHNQSTKHASVRGRDARVHHDTRGAQLRGNPSDMQEPRRTLYTSDRPRSAAQHGARNSGQAPHHRPVSAMHSQGPNSLHKKNMQHRGEHRGVIRSQGDSSNSRNRRGKGGGRRKEEDATQ